MDYHPNSVAVAAITKEAGLAGVSGRVGKSLWSTLNDKLTRGVNGLVTKALYGDRSRVALDNEMFWLKHRALQDKHYVVDRFKRIDENNAFYYPNKREIGFGNGFYDPGTLAHEVGHSEIPSTRVGKFIHDADKNRYNRAYNLRQKLYDLGIPAGIVQRIVPQPGNWGLRVLAEELRASHNGYQFLRENGLSRLESLGAYAGIPSYTGDLLVRYGGIPTAGYAAYKGRRGFSNMKNYLTTKAQNAATNVSNLLKPYLQ